jgi:hypothetical protein
MKRKIDWVLAVAATLTAICSSGNAQTDLTTWTFTPVDVPGATRMYVRGMNGAAQIVGHYTSGVVTRGFLLSGSVFTPIQLDVGTQACGINPRGDIVGEYSVTGVTGRFGFLLRDGAYTMISYPGATIPRTRPWKITPDGQHIVGFYDDLHGFVLSRKSLVP